MIPYFPQPELRVGPLVFHAFGALVGIGVILGIRVVRARAALAGVSQKSLGGLILCALVPGFWASFFLELVFYKPHVIRAEGLRSIVDFSHGMSSFGGIVGAAVGVFAWAAFHRRRWLVEADLLVQGFVVGWIFGRLGCTFAHDHQGALSDFFLATGYPGGARHNLGLYEFLYTLILLWPISTLIHRRFGSPPGMHGTVMALLYAPARFAMDFLRSTDQKDSDARYFGLTFAQYCCIALLLYGIASWPRAQKNWRGGVTAKTAVR